MKFIWLNSPRKTALGTICLWNYPNPIRNNDRGKNYFLSVLMLFWKFCVFVFSDLFWRGVMNSELFLETASEPCLYLYFLSTLVNSRVG